TYRLTSLLAGLIFVVSACGPAASTTAPTSAPVTGPAATTGATTAPTAAALSGTLTIWEAYGASGTSEKDAFDKIVGQVKTANPGLTVNVTDVPFNNLFTNFETQAAAGSGPDMYIAPNDSLPSEARNNLL